MADPSNFDPTDPKFSDSERSLETPLADSEKSVGVSVSDTSSGDAERGNWTGQFDFLISMVAYCVGLGNVWRFPYLCFKNGGGAFLVPYALSWVVIGVPLFFMEVALGQYLQKGGIKVWDVCPIFRGVGLASLLMSTYCNIYYAALISWALFYFFASFAAILPWKSCDHYWNNDRCRNFNYSSADSVMNGTIEASAMNESILFSVNENDTATLNDSIVYESPVQQFWENRVLKMSSKIHNGPEPVWELTLLLIFTWVLAYFALRKGITKLRKVIYVCALLPYVLLGIMLARAATLPGATDGMYFYLKPNLTKLTETTVWKDAGTQVFYSYGIGFGVLTAFGSYNRFHHNCKRDTILICAINGITSFTAGFVIFSVLGYMAHISGKEVADVVKSGPGLAFQVYPEVVATLKPAQLWAVLFFFMLIIIGLDSQVGNIEGVLTGISDAIPTFRKHKDKFVLGMCVICCLLGLPMVTRAGNNWVTLLDAFGASGFTLLIIVFCQTIGFSYGFGVEKVYNSLNEMLGYKPWKTWYYMWKYVTPAATLIIFLFISIKYEPLNSPDGVPYPDWVQGLGFLITCSSIILIPIWAIICVYRQRGDSLREKVQNAFKSRAYKTKIMNVEPQQHNGDVLSDGLLDDYPRQ